MRIGLFCFAREGLAIPKAEEEKNPKTYETDLLSISGGFGGLAAVIRIKELAPELSVLLVDKQTIGWGGKANKGAGV